MEDQTSFLFDAPRARTSDPITSHEAAASIAPEDLRPRLAAVLNLLAAFGPMTDELLARHYRNYPNLPKQSPSGLRTRRSELVELGLVAASGEYDYTASGRRSIKWETT